jgi:hypothetical protein
MTKKYVNPDFAAIENSLYQGRKTVVVKTNDPERLRKRLRYECDKWGMVWMFSKTEGELFIRQGKRKPIVIHPDCDLRPLAAAVLTKAVQDAIVDESKRSEAIDWLLNEAELYMDVIGIHPDNIVPIVEKIRDKKIAVNSKGAIYYKAQPPLSARGNGG